MAFLPYVPIGLDVIERIYQLVTKIRGRSQPSKNEELARLQEDVDLLKQAVELQAGMLQERETTLTQCVNSLERQVRGLKLQVWVLGIVLIALIVNTAVKLT